MQVVCIHCEAINRLPDEKSLSDAKCGKCANTIYDLSPIELNDRNFFRYIEKTDAPVIVDFWAGWCGPCVNMAPVFKSVASQSPNLIFAKVDTEDAQQVSAEAAIRSLPTLVFFHKGEEKNRISGLLNESQLKSWIMENIRQV